MSRWPVLVAALALAVGAGQHPSAGGGERGAGSSDHTVDSSGHGASADAAPAGSQQVLAGFDGPRPLARWSTRAGARLAVTATWSSGGGSAAAVTFPRWRPGQDPYPAAVLSLPVTDASAFDRLELEVYNPQSQRQELRLYLDDRRGRARLEVMVPGRTAISISEPLSQFAPVIDLTRVGQIGLYATRPQYACTLYVDQIRLRSDTGRDAAALADSAAALADSLARLVRAARSGGAAGGAAGGELPADMASAAAKASAVSQQAQQLAASLQSQEAPAPARAQAARQRLRRLQAEDLTGRAVALRLAGLLQARAGGDADFVLTAESPLRKVSLEAGRFSSPLASTARLSAAGNEYESFQAVVVPVRQALRQVRWGLTPLRGETGGELIGSVRLVGYVRTGQPCYPVPHTGWWPDPLLDSQQSVDLVPLGEVLPLWVTVHVPAGTRPGRYQGRLEVAVAGLRPQTLDIELRVRGFALPPTPALRTALSLRPLDPSLYPDRDPAAVTRQYEDWLLGEYGLNPGSIYATGPPSWDVDRLRQLVRMGLNGINLGYVNAPLEPELDLAAHWRRLEGQLAAMADWLPVAEAAGARDLCYVYCFDERPADQLDVVFRTAARIHARFPDIEVMTTAKQPDFSGGRRAGDAVDIWVPLTPEFDSSAAAIAAARARQRQVWWYVCLAPRRPYANLSVEYDAIEPRLLAGAMAARYRPEGFLYFALNRWPTTARPIASGPRTDWDPVSFPLTHGDGSLLCAGPRGPLATIRLENLRDGMEDLAYYRLAADLLRRHGLPTEPAQVPDSLVTNLASFSRDPAVLQAERERLATLIERLVH